MKTAKHCRGSEGYSPRGKTGAIRSGRLPPPRLEQRCFVRGGRSADPLAQLLELLLLQRAELRQLGESRDAGADARNVSGVGE